MAVPKLTTDFIAGDKGPESFRKREVTDGNLKLLTTLDAAHEIMCVKFSNDGSYIAAGLADGSIKIFSSESGQCLYSVTDSEATSGRLPVTSLSFLPPTFTGRAETQHLLLATYASGAIRLWHVTTGQCLRTTREQRATLTCHISPHEAKIITAGTDIFVNQYDLDTGELLQVFEPSDSRSDMDGHRCRVFAAQHHPVHMYMFVTGGWDDTVQIWDQRERHAVRHISGPHICGEGLDIDGTYDHLLTASWRKENVLQVWDLPTGRLIKDIPQDVNRKSLLYCGQWLGRDYIMCGGGDSNLARVIDRSSLNTVGVLLDLGQSVYSMDNDQQGNKSRLVVASGRWAYVLKLDKK